MNDFEDDGAFERKNDAEQLEHMEVEMASTGIFQSEGEAMHYWMAAQQCVLNVDHGYIIDRLKSDCPYVDAGWVGANWPNDAGDTVDSQWLDHLGDAGKLLLTTLAAELSAKGIDQARILVFFPCHRSLATVVFKGTEMVPRVIEWAQS